MGGDRRDQTKPGWENEPNPIAYKQEFDDDISRVRAHYVSQATDVTPIPPSSSSSPSSPSSPSPAEKGKEKGKENAGKEDEQEKKDVTIAPPAPEVNPSFLKRARVCLKRFEAIKWNLYTPVGNLKDPLFIVEYARVHFYQFTLLACALAAAFVICHAWTAGPDDKYSFYFYASMFFLQACAHLFFNQFYDVLAATPETAQGYADRIWAKKFVMIIWLMFFCMTLLGPKKYINVNIFHDPDGLVGHGFVCLCVRFAAVINFFVFLIYAMLDSFQMAVLYSRE